MDNVHYFYHLANLLNKANDTGKYYYISVDDVVEACRERKILNFLSEEFNNIKELEFFKSFDDRNNFLTSLQDKVINGEGEEIKRNGLCFLGSICLNELGKVLPKK